MQKLLCKNCYSKITNVHDYLQDIRNCTSKYLEEGSVRVKRCASSPLTPNPVASKDISGVNSKSRKQLKLEPDEPVPDCPKVEPNLPIMNDHGYVHVTVS